MFCLFWGKTAFHPRHDFGHQLLSASSEISFMTSHPCAKGRSRSIASGQTEAITPEMWQKNEQCPRPLNFPASKLFPVTRPPGLVVG